MSVPGGCNPLRFDMLLLMNDGKKESLNHLFEIYRHTVLETGSPPPSVYAFCKEAGIEEASFFEEFSSLDSLEGEIWAERIDHVVGILSSDPEYAGYPPREKVLAFLYTFLEAIKGHRSWFLVRFPRKMTDRDPAVLNRFRERFHDWANPIAAEALADRGPLKRLNPDRLLKKTLYFHFRTVVKYYLEDDSPGFEKTDAYVEKTVRLLFDLVETNLPDSAVDLFRFLSGKHG